MIVGSSMGGWIMLLTALARPQRVAGLLGIAAAPDFTEDLLPQSLTEEHLQTIESSGVVVIPSDYEDPYTITKALLDDGNQSYRVEQGDCTRLPRSITPRPGRLICAMATITNPTGKTAVR